MKKGYSFLLLAIVLQFIVCHSVWSQAIPIPEPILPDGSHNPADTGNSYGEAFKSSVEGVLPYVEGFLTYPSGNRFIAFGNFSNFNGRPSPGAVRLLDSSAAPIRPVDYSFKASFNLQNGFPRKAAFMPNQKILFSGDFTSYSSVSVNQLVRLFPDGSLDFDFHANIGSGPGGGEIRDIKVDSDGNIFIAGTFSSFNGIPRNKLAKLDSTGQLDSAFSGFLGPAGGEINSIEFVAGKLLVTGSFLTYNGNPAFQRYAAVNTSTGTTDASVPPVALPAGIIRRVKPISGLGRAAVLISTSAGGFEIRQVDVISGTVFPGFSVGSILPLGAQITDFFAESGSILVVGNFVEFNTGSAVPFKRIAKLSWSGSPVAGFNPGTGPNDEASCVVPSPTPGFFLIGGAFDKVNNLFRGAAAKLNSSTGATAALSKGSGANGGPVYCSLVMPDNKIVIGGSFGYFNWNLRNGITRVNSDGSNDPTFNPGSGTNGSIHALTLQEDGKILAGGSFSLYNGSSRSGIVRLLSDGSPDPLFNSPSLPMDTVFAIAVQKNNKILVGGSFTDYNGTPAGRIIRLHPDGSPDLNFVSNSGGGFNRTVRAIALFKNASGQDTLIFVGGDFSTYKTGVLRRNLVVLDTSGNPLSSGTGINPGGRVGAIAIDAAKQQVYAGGLFSQTYNGNTHLNIGRFAFSLSADISFEPFNGVDVEVYSILHESGRRGVILSCDTGNSKLGGPSRGFIKLKPKGSKDLTIGNGNGASGPVFSIKRDKSGKLILVGDFTKFDSVGKNRILRMLKDPFETTVWNGGEWDWDAPDCDFSAIIADRYRNPGFNCKNLYVVQNVKFYPHTTPVEVCGDAFCWSSKIDSAESEVYLTGSTKQEVEGYFRHLSLDNDSGASVYGPTWIDGSLKLWKGTLSTNNFLTLKSNASRTGRLAKVENGANLDGNITLERYVGGGTASWHFMGTPIKNQAQSDWTDDFLILPSFIYRHNDSSNVQNGWEQSSDSLSIGKGFRVFLNQPFFNAGARFENTGPAQIGNFSFPISFSPNGYGGGGWNLLANPYPCEVDWHAFSASNVGSQIHYWNTNVYASYSSATQVGVNGGSRYIPSSQGFFVKASQAGASLSVTEDAKPLVAQNQSYFRTAAEEFEDLARMTLYAPGNLKDETAIRWMPDAQPWFEPEYDADKLENPEINLFTMTAEGRRSSIQARKFSGADSVHLGISVQEAGNYLLEIKLGTWLGEGRIWYLRDNESGYYTLVENGSFVPFQVEEDGLLSPYRFTLIGSEPSAGSTELIRAKKIYASPNPGKGKFRIHGLNSPIRYHLQNAAGNLVREGMTNGELHLENAVPGVYFLRFPEMAGRNEVLRLIILP